MPETEELKLVVSLDANTAVAGLRGLRQEVTELGGGNAAQNLERFRRNTQEAHQKGLKPFSDDLQEATKRMVPFVTGIGGIATGLIAVGYAADKALDALGDFAKIHERIGVLGKQTGFDPAFVKMFQEQFKLRGVEDATRDLEGLSHIMADITRVNSEFRQKMMQAQQLGAPTEAMQKWLGELTEIKDPSRFANKLREGLENIRRNAIEKFGEQRGAEAFRKFEATIGMPDLDRLKQDLPEITAEQSKAEASRQAAADQYLSTTREIEHSWEKIKTSWFDEGITGGPLMDAMRYIDDVLKRWAEAAEKAQALAREHPAPEGFWPKLNPFDPKNIEREKAVAPELHENESPLGNWFRNKFGSPGGAQPLLGGGEPDWFKNAPESTNIEDRRGEQDDALKATHELTEQLKRLADDIEGTGAAGTAGGLGLLSPGGGISMRGLGGLPGMGGAAGGGGGGSGISAGVDGMGAHPSFGGHHQGTGTGTDTGTGGDGASGDLDRGKFDQMFKGTPLAGQYDAVVKAAAENNVPASLVAGIMAHETGQGTSKMLRDRLNPAGLMDPATGMSKGKTFATIGEGIKAAAATIAKNYRKGGSTIAGMAGIYAPPGAANDPRGLNKGWAAGVEGFVKRLAGTPSGGDGASTPTMTGDITGTGPSGGRFNQPAGTPLIGQQDRETVTLANGQRFTVNKRTAAQFQGFFNDLIKAGAPVHNLAGLGMRGNPSQHPGGFAVDWAQNARDKVDPSTRAWIEQHPDALNAIEQKWGISGGEHWKHKDTGHFSIETLYGSEHLKQAQGASGSGVAGAHRNRFIDQAMSQRVEGTGKLSVHVNAPKGTRVGAEGRGIFKKTEVTRQTQMEPAASSMASQYEE